jgi:lipopolysaccharide/colanic/teichoic acid biosynthesis glycosyltransferase
VLKRLFDILSSCAGLVLLSPILLFLSIAIKRHDKGPVLYRGVRVGRGGVLFKMFKFRTMVVNAEQLGGSSTADDDRRITTIGRFMRKYKLDELPQLINILRGEMSFVGPRPQVTWAVELYNTDQMRLLSVRPGITDYASIKFRNEGELLKGSEDPDRDYLAKIAPEKLRLGLEYVDKMSLITDLRIILATAKALCRSS